MKTTRTLSFVWITVFVSFAIPFFTTCKNNIGLGGSIDINPPNIVVTSPPPAAVVRNSFTLRGTIKDDTAVQSVTVSFVRRDGKADTVFAAVDNQNGTWSAHLNRKKGDAVFPLKDGQHTFTIIAKDSSGKEDKTEAVVIIDNTAPFLVLNRPSSILPPQGSTLESTVDVFGDKFVLSGQVADVNNAAKLEITAKEKDGTATKTKVFKNVPPTIDLTVDTFSLKTGEQEDDKNKDFYRGIYGTNESGGVKEFTYTLAVWDGAKEYESPDSDGHKDEGNKTDVYYLYDTLYEKIFASGELKMYDIYAMQNDTYNGTGIGRTAVSVTPEKVAEVLAFLKMPDNMMGGGTGGKTGLFGLNPAKNPKFSIDGFKPVASTNPVDYQRVYAGAVLNVKLLRNLDKTPFADNYTATYKIKLRQLGSSVEKELSNVTFALQDGVLTASAVLDGLEVGKVYVVEVAGKDKDGNDFIPERGKNDAGNYGFVFARTGRAPEIVVSEINGTTASGGENVTERIYIKKGGNITFKAELKEAAQADLTYRLFLNGSQNMTEVQPISGSQTFTLDASHFDQTNGGAYQLRLRAYDNATAQSSVEQTYHIYYDVLPPQINIESPIAGERRNSDNKRLTISGTAFDAGSGVEMPITVELKKNGVAVATPAVTGSENWTLQEIDLSTSGYGEGEYTLKVTAKDKLGQNNSVVRSFLYDAAAPQITSLIADGKEIRDGATVYRNTESITIAGTIAETHGLKTLTIGGEQYTPVAAGAFSKTLTLSEGSHDITVRAVDKADKETVTTFTVVTDKTMPLFNEIKIGGSLAGNTQPLVVLVAPVPFEGIISDSGSGIQKVEYALDKKTDGTWNWQRVNVVEEGSIIRFDGYAQIAVNTQKKLALKVTDKAGNATEREQDIRVASLNVYLTLELPAVLTGGIDGIVPSRKGSFDVKFGAYLEAASGLETATVTVKNESNSVVALEQFFDNWQPISITNSVGLSPEIRKTKVTLQSGLYTITINAKGQEKSIRVVIDNEGPNIELLSPSLTEAQAGEITVQGSISDRSPVETTGTKYLIAKTSALPSDGPTPETAGWTDMQTSTAGSWSFKFKLTETLGTDASNITAYGGVLVSDANYKIPVYILTEDKLGNKKVHKKEILYDSIGTRPVAEILSPVSDAVLGGTIQIFGTAKVAVGNPSHIGVVEIQFSKSGNFNNEADGTFGSKNWYNGGNGQQIPNTSNNADQQGGASWSIAINDDGSFNAAGNEQQTVYFRVRAKNRQVGTQGLWSEKRKIIIDKSAPTIGSPDPLQITDSNGTNPVPFVPNMWIARNKKLTGSLYDKAGIKQITVSGDLENGAIKTLTMPISDSWFTVDSHTEHQPSESSSGSSKNYIMDIPLNLDALTATAKAQNAFSVKLRIVEDTTTGLTSERELPFRFDIVDPVGDFGKDIHTSIGSFTATSITDANLAAKIGSDWQGLKIIANNKILTVTNKTGDSIQFSPTVTAGTHNYIVYKPEPLLYNGTGKWRIRGVANDDGSGVKKVEAWVKVSDKETKHTVMTELDPSNKITKSIGGLVTWEGEIDLADSTTDLPDGKGTVHFTITDDSGNKHTASCAVRVKNKPVAVSKIQLLTDIGGQTIKTDETGKPEKTEQAGSLNAERNYEGTVKSQNFAFKSTTSSKIKVEFSGGQGTVKYKLLYNNTVLGNHNLVAITSGTEITLTESDLQTIQNSNGTPKNLVLELWDSAIGYTLGTDSSFAKVTITTLFDALDDKNPSVVILPFYWNGENDNSLQDNKRTNGHLEIGKVTGLTGSSSDDNDYSSVSGKVSVRGFIYDNIKLDSLTVTISDAATVTATRTGTAWNSTPNTEKGMTLTVEKSEADYLGYYLTWRLDWDTEKTSVGLAKEIKVTAGDGRNTSAVSDVSGTNMPAAETVERASLHTAKHTSFSQAKAGQFISFIAGEAFYLTRVKTVGTDGTLTLEKEIPITAITAKLYKSEANHSQTKVNIVPYITGIETPNRTQSGLSANTIRSSDGKYSIIKGSTSNFVEVKGFNLESPTVRLVKKEEVTTATETTGLQITHSGSNNSGFKFENSLAKSGYLEVFVTSSGSNKVKAINNINDNTKPYNKEEDAVLLKNKTFSDDRYLRVFDMKETPIKNGYYPEMIMDGNDPVFGYVNLSGASSGAAGGYYDDHAMPQRAKFDGTNGTVSTTEYLIKASIWDQMGMAKDDAGKYYHATTYDRAGAAMSLIYDKYASLHGGTTSTSQTYSSGMGWGSGTQYGNYNNNDASHKPNNNALTLESVNLNSLLLGRYQYPKLIAKGNSVTNKAVVYMAYYDANTSNKQIFFRNFQIGKKENVAGQDTTSPFTKFQLHASSNCWTNLEENSSAPSSSSFTTYTTGRLDGATSASQYFDIGVTNDNHVVLVYFDEDAGKLKLKYSTTAVDGSAPAATVTWTESTVSFPEYTGTYVSMDIDQNNGIHIAAFDSSNGDLKYFYLSSYSSNDLKIALVDAAFSVGQWTQVKVHNNVPYIAYCNNSEAGQRSAIKLAYAKDEAGTVKDGVDNSGFVTGDWECMTVPTVKPAQSGTPKFKKVNLGFDTAGTPVLGYLGEKIEFGKWLGE